MTQLRIHLVEDDRLLAMKLSMLLNEKGYEVIGMSHSYPEAIEDLQKQLPDLLIVDIDLGGGGTGIDLVQLLPAENRIPFIFLSGMYDPETIAAAKKTLPVTFLSKPIRDKDVHLAIEMAIAKHQEQDVEPPEAQDGAMLLQDSIFVKSGSDYLNVPIDSINWIKGEGNYTTIFRNNKELTLRASLKDLAVLLEKPEIMKVHRSYMINIKKIDRISKNHVVIGAVEIPINKEMRTLLLEGLRTVR